MKESLLKKQKKSKIINQNISLDNFNTILDNFKSSKFNKKKKKKKKAS